MIVAFLCLSMIILDIFQQFTLPYLFFFFNSSERVGRNIWRPRYVFNFGTVSEYFIEYLSHEWFLPW